MLRMLSKTTLIVHACYVPSYVPCRRAEIRMKIFEAQDGCLGAHVKWALHKTGMCKIVISPPDGDRTFKTVVRLKNVEDDPAVAVQAKLLQLGWGPLLEPAAATPEPSSEASNADAEVHGCHRTRRRVRRISLRRMTWSCCLSSRRLWVGR